MSEKKSPVRIGKAKNPTGEGTEPEAKTKAPEKTVSAKQRAAERRIRDETKHSALVSKSQNKALVAAGAALIDHEDEKDEVEDQPTSSLSKPPAPPAYVTTKLKEVKDKPKPTSGKLSFDDVLRQQAQVVAQPALELAAFLK